MDIAIVVILALFLLACLYFKVGDIFSPWFLTAGVWMAILLLFQLEGDMLDPLSSQFYTSLSLWLPIFIGSSLMTYATLPRAGRPDVAVASDMVVNEKVFNFLYVVAMVLSPLYLYQVMQVVTQFDTSNLLNNIRVLAVHGDEDYGFLNYAFVLNEVLLIIAIWRYPKIPLWQLLTIYLAHMVSCFAIMEKGGVFLMVLATVYILYEKRVIKARSIAVTGVLLLVFFFVMNLARANQDTIDDQDVTFMDFFALYIMSPSVAFGRVQVDLFPQFGSHTLTTFYLILNRLGGDFVLNQKLQDFVWVPMPTNVYTIFQPFYMDFGFAGVAFFALVYGLFSGWVYRLYRNGSGMGKALYTYLVYALVLQFYQENIFMGMVFFMQMVFFMWLCLQHTVSFTFKPWGKHSSQSLPVEETP